MGYGKRMTKKIEDERKFLVDLKTFTAWRTEAEPGEEYSNATLYVNDEIKVRQGYLSLVPPVTRIRLSDAQQSGESYATVTAKGPGLQRKKEAEGVLERFSDGDSLFSMCKVTVIKTRWLISFKGKCWEVDVFEKKLRGLCMAELENQSMPDKKRVPPWLGREVTKDKRYSNVMLAQFGVPDDYRR